MPRVRIWRQQHESMDPICLVNGKCQNVRMSEWERNVTLTMELLLVPDRVV